MKKYEMDALWESISKNPNTPVYSQDEMQVLLDRLDFAIDDGSPEEVQELMSQIDDLTTANFPD